MTKPRDKGPGPYHSDSDQIATPGREANAARTPPDAAAEPGQPERYPSVRRDDSVEPAQPGAGSDA